MNTSNGYNANGTFDSGFIGESIYFSNSAYVRLENSNNTDFGIAAGKDGKMTIMCWYYPTQSTTSARVLISNEDWYKGLNPGVTIDAQYLTGPDFNFGDGVQAHRCEYVAKKTVANKWQFVAVSADIQAGTADLYYGAVDGNLQLLKTMDISNLDSFLSSYKWYLATDYSNYDYYFRGYMDEVAFWNRALTQAEVTSIFNNQKAGTGLGVQLARAAGGSVTQGDGTWDTDTNWSYRGIPDSQTDVFINHSITDSSDRTINANMTINNDGTYMSSGTLKLGDGENLTGTLILNGGTASVDGLVLSSNSGVNISAGTLNIDSSSTLYNLSGGSLGENDQIAVPGHLIVNGKLTLDNDAMSKFIGSISAETIEKTGDGTLQLYSSAANMISAESLVISSGRLDMKEYFKGSLTVGEKLEGDDNYSIATFSPGNSVGTLTIDGSDLAE
ncbi:MAG: LamG domain-containing protein, partial [Thermoguttaceae bacterium]|nr:LamG domain-containing protein [Thermoguttaceae bacterium]